MIPRSPIVGRFLWLRKTHSVSYHLQGRSCLFRLQVHACQPVHTRPDFLTCRRFSSSRTLSSQNNAHDEPSPETQNKLTVRENIYTIPNFLTVSRILACPVLGWGIITDNFYLATSVLVYAGLTDLADGYLARRYQMKTVLGTILDPAADKTLMTTLTVTLALKNLIPAPLAIVILGRDVLLSLSAFYIRYTSLSHPKTWSRYWDMSIPSVEVRPTDISKVNTALQLMLMGLTVINPILPLDLGSGLHIMNWVVGVTTVGSGLSYVFSKDAIRILSQTRKPPS